MNISSTSTSKIVIFIWQKLLIILYPLLYFLYLFLYLLFHSGFIYLYLFIPY